MSMRVVETAMLWLFILRPAWSVAITLPSNQHRSTERDTGPAILPPPGLRPSAAPDSGANNTNGDDQHDLTPVETGCLIAAVVLTIVVPFIVMYIVSRRRKAAQLKEDAGRGAARGGVVIGGVSTYDTGSEESLAKGMECRTTEVGSQDGSSRSSFLSM